MLYIIHLSKFLIFSMSCIIDVANLLWRSSWRENLDGPSDNDGADTSAVHATFL